ncbi:gamma-interferon-responsive lysosomal thiol protein-like [Andrographis paniculata]|uniref:gamma-interferon-responsive lysosomal thiol protein-like n=1 Tax=Andrographis paniculata TaxID=175694 RepID=UPI0021E7EB80|nr:gamma-interferon-responsive lysosomal thiol protein-like [Andrographis paniculata]
MAVAAAAGRRHHVSVVSCILLLLLVSFILSESQEDDKVVVSVYYEALCPYCANFIVKHLVKIFQTDLINIVNLRLVPWGNTHITINNTWICQHGVDECRLDVVEACAINLLPTLQSQFEFIYCVERLHLMNKHAQTQWPSCFQPDHATVLQSCYNTALGFQLEKAYSDETTNLQPPHRFVPWVLVNGYPLQEDFLNFASYVCNAYRGYNIPDTCKSSTSSNLPIN